MPARLARLCDITLLLPTRGTRWGGGVCNECRLELRSVWRFKKTNRGTVLLCEQCKVVVEERSRPYRDAMGAAFSGGAFNPR